MSELNAWSRFQGLTSAGVLMIGTVTAHLPGNQSRVEYPGGSIVTVDGQDVAVGGRAFVRNGAIAAPASELMTIEIEV